MGSTVSTSLTGGGDITLWRQVDVPQGTTDAALIRMSDPDARKELDLLLRALGRGTTGSAIGAALASLGADITEDTPAGVRARLVAGLREVRLCDLDPRASTKLLAFAGVVQGVLVTLIPSSGIESNLPPLPGQRVRTPRNGAAEFSLEMIYELPMLALLAVPRLDRLARRMAFQGPLLDALRDQDVRIWDENGVHDLVDVGQMLITSMEATTGGDGDAIKYKTKMIGGRINALEVAGETEFSSRDFNYLQCPPGYGPLWREEPTGARLPVKGSIVVILSQATAVREIWTMFGDGCTRSAIGDRLAAMGWRLRDGSGRTMADIPGWHRVQIVSKMVSAETAALHETGDWEVERSTAAPIRQAGGRVLARRADGRRAVTVSGRLPVHMVNGLPWGVAPDVWTKVRARHERERHETASDRGGRWSTHLMHMSPPVWVDGSWQRFVKDHSTLQLRSLTGGDIDHEPEWDPSLTSLVAARNFIEAMRRLGTQLLTRLALAGAGEVELAFVPDTETDMVRGLRAELAEASARSDAATRAATTAAELAALAQQAGRGAAAMEQLTLQDQHLLVAADAVAAEAQLGAQLRVAGEASGQCRANLRTPLGVAAALTRWDGSPDPVLRAALADLGLVASMRGRYDRDSGQITMTAAATITLADGDEAKLPLNLALPNTSNARDLAADAPALVRAWAAGARLEDLAVGHRTAGWVRRTLNGWLQLHGIDTMGAALLDNQVPATRCAVIEALAPDLLGLAVTKLPAATADRLTAPYLADPGGSWKAWTGGAHAADRRLIAALRIAGGEADIAALEAAAGSDTTWFAAPRGNRPAIGGAPSRSRRGLLLCPHADCPNPAAVHVLYVPETAHYGRLCRACHRLPDLKLSHVIFPDEYFVAWDRALLNGRACTVRSGASELRLPDMATARLAGELVRPGEAAAILGVTIGYLGELRRAGKLPPPVDCGGVALLRRTEIEALTAGRTGASRFSIKDGWWSPAQAATRLGVPESRVRRYCAEGLLAYRRTKPGPSGRLRLKPAVVMAFTPPAGDLTCALSIPDVCRQTGLTRHTVSDAIESGQLTSVLALFGERRVLPDAVRGWAASRPIAPARPARIPAPGAGTAIDGRLSVSAAAAVLNLSPKQVRAMADRGTLASSRGDCGSWRWFDEADVYALAEVLTR